jgi:hypothetical protein
VVRLADDSNMTGSRSTARPGTPNPISPVPAARKSPR